MAKIFYLGSGNPKIKVPVVGGWKAKCNVLGNGRGATLVCTLKGHAGVITDIDVSIDNSLLATASEDGDCRIWGLVDGSPVAVLRGHVGGVNMVSLYMYYTTIIFLLMSIFCAGTMKNTFEEIDLDISIHNHAGFGSHNLAVLT